MIAATERTVEAMREGHRLITQAPVFDASEPWFRDGSEGDNIDPEDLESGQFGFVDALRRVDGVPSDFGDYSYEVVEIKLSKQLRPKFVHQVSLYTRALAKLQGCTPRLAYLRLGDGREEPIEVGRFLAAHKQAEGRLRGFVSEPPSLPAVPEPVAHCQLCQLEKECAKARRDVDHLSLVAGASASARETLEKAGIPTLAALAQAGGEAPHDLGSETWSRLTSQAALQLESRQTGKPTWRNREPEEGLGYAQLPPADPADIFFDLEGDPYEGPDGLEYLWGWVDADGNYSHKAARTDQEEKRALEEFIDFAHARWVENPGMHIFFYAPHERSKLGSLSVKYGTREAELDALLRNRVLVDLLAIVRQALQVGEESYSLKKLERHHGFTRTEETVRGGGGSIVAYETFLILTAEGKDGEAEEFLDAIREYNKDDCRSTLSLRNWLIDVTKTAAQEEWPDSDLDYVAEEFKEAPESIDDLFELAERLREGLPDDPNEDTAMEASRRLLASLLFYHRREGKCMYWRHFELRSMSAEDLQYEPDAIGPMRFDDETPPAPVKSSLVYRFAFPPQEVKWGGAGPAYLETGMPANEQERGDDWILISRGRNHDRPLTRGLISGTPIGTGPLVAALVDFAESLLAGNTDRFPASFALLAQKPPEATGTDLGLEAEALCDDLREMKPGILPIQGPPGAGKTHNGAKMILDAIARGKRVGITAFSHKAIQNLMAEVEDQAAAARTSQSLRGGYKASKAHADEWSERTLGLIRPHKDPIADDDLNLIAGTAWAFSTEDARQTIDILFIDEAGQYPLANSLSAGTAAREGMVLLGDPQQLPQVMQALHPDGAERSALGHVLADNKTIPPDRGVLLDESWRMHPEICGFISWLSYDQRLKPKQDCDVREIQAEARVSGSGLRFVEVEHHGCSQSSQREGEVIAELCEELLATKATVVEPNRDESTPVVKTKPLTAEDIMVVAPYNLAVARIRKHVSSGVRVGTVDKFQGQEAPIVFYAMTASSAEDAPRGIGFLFDDHRFNVAISRAQCLAIVIANPRLLDAPARSVEQLELINNLCEYRRRATLIAV